MSWPPDYAGMTITGDRSGFVWGAPKDAPGLIKLVGLDGALSVKVRLRPKRVGVAFVRMPDGARVFRVTAGDDCLIVDAKDEVARNVRIKL